MLTHIVAYYKYSRYAIDDRVVELSKSDPNIHKLVYEI